MQAKTKTDASVGRWLLNDEVVLLRWWASERTQVIPGGTKELVLGADESCWLQLEDDRGRASRKHATLRSVDGKWLLQDAGSRNGMLVDSVKCSEVELEPGMEVWFGGVTLVAESARSM